MAAALPGMDVAENRPPEDSILFNYIYIMEHCMNYFNFTLLFKINLLDENLWKYYLLNVSNLFLNCNVFIINIIYLTKNININSN